MAGAPGEAARGAAGPPRMSRRRARVEDPGGRPAAAWRDGDVFQPTEMPVIVG